MAEKVYRIDNVKKFRAAGPTDMIELIAAPGANRLYLPKSWIVILVYGFVHKELVHLSGPTGSAKSSVLDALCVPENFCSVCAAEGFATDRPVRIYPVEMATFESPAELYYRRALRDGTTFDEPSILVRALQQAARDKDCCTPVIWLREMGRVHSPSVQGGLLNLMTRTAIPLPDGTSIDGSDIAWVADSNYQADSDATHTLVTLDDALKRRFTIHLTLDYLSAEQEVQVLNHLIDQYALGEGARELAPRVVGLGHAIRQQRHEGSLQTVAPPTIYGYLSMLRMARSLPGLTMKDIAFSTMLGNAGIDDTKLAGATFNEVFGLQTDLDEEACSVGGNLF